MAEHVYHTKDCFNVIISCKMTAVLASIVLQVLSHVSSPVEINDSARMRSGLTESCRVVDKDCPFMKINIVVHKCY